MSSEAAAHAHPKGLAHHFETYEQQKESSFLGMWLFICQEVMFFGGAFAAYVNYRVMYPEAMIAGSQQLDVPIGAMNTLVLLCSSFTMVYAVWAAQSGTTKWGWSQLGTMHIVTRSDRHAGLRHRVPGRQVLRVRREVRPPPGAGLQLHPAGVQYRQPGSHRDLLQSLLRHDRLHALHMVVGIGIMLVMIPLALRASGTRTTTTSSKGSASTGTSSTSCGSSSSRSSTSSARASPNSHSRSHLT